MELSELLALLEQDPTKAVNAVKQLKGNFLNTVYPRLVKEWDTRTHAVTVVDDKRPDKEVPTRTGQGTKTVPVARLTIPLQKQIVRRAAQFLCGIPVQIDRGGVKEGSPEAKVCDWLQKVWDDNKLDYDSKKQVTLLLSETEVAEIWFLEDVEEDYWKGTAIENPGVRKRPRVMTLANKNGDELHPIFDDTENMVAFCRGYETVDGEDTTAHFDIYTDKTIYKLESLKGGTYFMADGFPAVNPLGKIPVVYMAQEHEEWYDVQSMIERLEYLMSTLTDINDYFGSPILTIKAEKKDEVEWVSKNESGRAVLLKNGAAAEYLTWEQSPESIAMELKDLRSKIMDYTDTPDISFDQVKGLGTYSGIALRMIFGAAHMKASDKEEIVGKAFQRRLNLLLSIAAYLKPSIKGSTKISVKPKFTYYMPQNVLEELQALQMALDMGIISTETAVNLCSLIEDKKAELAKLEKQKQDAQSQAAKAGKLNALMGGLDDSGEEDQNAA